MAFNADKAHEVENGVVLGKDGPGLFHSDTKPSQPAPIGARAFSQTSPNKAWMKYGAGDSDWALFDLVGSPNIVRVEKNAGEAPFTSIKAANDSITDASSTNQYLILVGPGVYVEPQIVMKAFVSIQGWETQAVTVTPQDPTNHLFVGAAATLRFLTIKGVTTAGKAGVYSTASGLQVRNCVVRDNPINILIEGVASLASITASDLIITGVFTTGIHIKNSGAGVQGVFKDSIINSVTASSGSRGGLVEGASTSFIFTGLIASGVSTVNCLSVKDAGTLKVLGCEIKGFNNAIWVENSGASPVIDVMAANLDSNVKDLQVDHATATGAFQGIAQLTKVSNASANTLQLSYQDPVTGDLNCSRILSTRGFATQLTTVVTSGAVTQMISHDAHTYVTTGTTEGEILQLPDATTLRNGHRFNIINEATKNVTVRQYGSSNPVVLIPQNSATYVLRDNSTSAGVWSRQVSSPASVFGGVTPAFFFSKAGTCTVGTYMRTGEVQTNRTGQLVKGSNQIIELSISNEAAVGSTTRVQLQRRTGASTFSDITDAYVDLPSGQYKATRSLSVIIGPDEEISAYNKSGSTLNDAVLCMYVTGT